MESNSLRTGWGCLNRDQNSYHLTLVSAPQNSGFFFSIKAHFSTAPLNPRYRIHFPHMYNFSIINIPHLKGTFICSGELVVYISGITPCCAFYVFGQINNDMHPSLWCIITALKVSAVAIPVTEVHYNHRFLYWLHSFARTWFLNTYLWKY